MAQKKNVQPGDKYGHLTVIKEVGKDKHGIRQFLYQCDCGKQKIIRHFGITRSCGHITIPLASAAAGKSRRLPEGEANFRSLWVVCRARARSYGRVWKITIEQFRHLTKQPCTYCGCQPSSKMFKARSHGPYFYNGLDRLDSTIGYTMENVVPACSDCNHMKGTLTPIQFLEKLKRILAHYEPNCVEAAN